MNGQRFGALLKEAEEMSIHTSMVVNGQELELREQCLYIYSPTRYTM